MSNTELNFSKTVKGIFKKKSSICLLALFLSNFSPFLSKEKNIDYFFLMEFLSVNQPNIKKYFFFPLSTLNLFKSYALKKITKKRCKAHIFLRFCFLLNVRKQKWIIFLKGFVLSSSKTRNDFLF